MSCCKSGSPSPDLPAAAAQQSAGRRSGAYTVVPRHLAVDDDRAVAARMLHATPFAARKVVRDIADPIRLDPEPSEIVDDDVCRQPFAQNVAVAEAGRMR